MADHSIRREILTASYLSGHGHLPSCFSCVEILCAVYETAAEDDVVILSKAHASLALYAVLNKYRDAQLDLATYCAKGSMLGGHADRLKVPGVHVSCGSLGNGLAMGVGMAMAGKRVYCICGDGEMQEGVAYEACKVAYDGAFKNLTVIVDCNDDGDGWPLRIPKTYPPGRILRIHTQKGYPCPTLMNDPGAWHHRAPNKPEYEQLMSELEEAEGLCVT